MVDCRLKIGREVWEGIFYLESKSLLNTWVNLDKPNKPHSRVRNTNEKGATWTLKCELRFNLSLGFGKIHSNSQYSVLTAFEMR